MNFILNETQILYVLYQLRIFFPIQNTLYIFYFCIIFFFFCLRERTFLKHKDKHCFKSFALTIRARLPYIDLVDENTNRFMYIVLGSIIRVFHSIDNFMNLFSMCTGWSIQANCIVLTLKVINYQRMLFIKICTDVGSKCIFNS